MKQPLITPVVQSEQDIIDFISKVGWGNLEDYWHPSMGIFYNNKNDAVVMMLVREWANAEEGIGGPMDYNNETLMGLNLMFQDVDIAVSMMEAEKEFEEDNND